MLLYRGVSLELDRANDGKLRPRGRQLAVLMTYGDGVLGMSHSGKFAHGPSEANAVRAHHLKSGLHDGCYLSFSRSEKIAVRFATSGGHRPGIVYVVDERRFSRFGVIPSEFPDPEYPDEVEVSLRASDAGDIPLGIVVAKYLYNPENEGDL